MPSVLPCTLLPLLSLLFLFVGHMTVAEMKEWCIADEQTPAEELQMALDWACGKGGADCSKIQAKQACFFPNTVTDHASYAFNNYYHKYKHHGASCYFNSAGFITDLDPSHGPCKFDSNP